MRPLKILTFFFSLCFAKQLTAQDNIRFQEFSVDNGLSHNTVNCVFQDSRGFMWFATQNGLNKYDGGTFLTYKNNAADSATISGNDVYSAFEDKNHNLWFGTGAGLSRYNRKTDSFSNYDVFLNGQYAMRPVWCMAEESNGSTVWIGASGGLFAFDTRTKKIRHFIIHDSIQNANSIRALCSDSRGNLWVGTYFGGLYQFDKSNTTFKAMQTESHRLNDRNGVMSIVEDSEGSVWIGREDGMLTRYNYHDDAFTSYTDLHAKYPINVICQTRDGRLAIGTDKGGVFFLDQAKQQLTPLRAKSGSETDVVLSLLSDLKGDLWLGTFRGGAFLFDKMDTVFSQILPYHEIKNPDSESNSILSVLHDGENLWIGTDGGGVIQRSRNISRNYKKATGNSIAGNTVVTIAATNDKIFFGTYADGLSVLDKKNGKFSTYTIDHGLSDNSIWALYPDGDFLWIGTNKGGLNLFNIKRKTFKYFTNTLKDDRTISSNTIRSILKDSRGKLWIGTVSGLNVFHPHDSTFSNYLHTKSVMSDINVRCIYEDSKKNIWLGTYGGGLNKYDCNNDSFVYYKEENGLSGNIILGIMEDTQGNLWISTNKGISRFDPEKNKFKNFDAKIGPGNTQFNHGAFCKNENGQMFFGTTNGVCAFYPHKILENNFSPPVVLAELSLFNKPVAIGGNSVLKQSLNETTELVLDYDQSVLSFRFAALNFTHSDKNQFAYMLEPFDKTWNEVGNARTATYTNLDPGEYLFKVKGSNNDNVWNETPATLRLIINPPYWKTWWFRFLLAGAAITILYAAYKVKINGMKRQEEILTNIVNQRTAEIEEKNKQILESEKQNSQLIHQKLHHELTLKSKELTNYTLLIIQKNKLLEDLKSNLKDAVRNPASSNLRDFKNLLKIINQNFSSEKEWSEFNANFNRFHEGFADILKNKFPELTNNDLRLCALYRVNIPTKEIAEAMGISQTSVKMARYRLRKKLALNPEEDIGEFLKNLR